MKTKTELLAIVKMDASKNMMQRACIDYEAWVSIMFELGCLFCEKYAPPGWSVPLLQNRENGYWNWFLMHYMEDDAVLLYFDGIIDQLSYRRQKLNLMYMHEMVDDFNFYLKRVHEKI